MPIPVPLDEYPVHQVPLFHSEVGSTDRNFYDRCIMHAYDRDGGVQIATGLGVYPNLGVIDAYVVIRKDGRQHAVRASGALGPDRMKQEVGPYRIEVPAPLSSVRVVCDAPEQGISIDLTFTSPFAPLPEPRHVHRSDYKPLLDAFRPDRRLDRHRHARRRADRRHPADLVRLARPLVGHPALG